MQKGLTPGQQGNKHPVFYQDKHGIWPCMQITSVHSHQSCTCGNSSVPFIQHCEFVYLHRDILSWLHLELLIYLILQCIAYYNTLQNYNDDNREDVTLLSLSPQGFYFAISTSEVLVVHSSYC